MDIDAAATEVFVTNLVFFQIGIIAAVAAVVLVIVILLWIFVLIPIYSRRYWHWTMCTTQLRILCKVFVTKLHQIWLFQLDIVYSISKEFFRDFICNWEWRHIVPCLYFTTIAFLINVPPKEIWWKNDIPPPNKRTPFMSQIKWQFSNPPPT